MSSFSLSQVVRTLWIELRAQVSAHDELDMATTRLRLRMPDEPVPDPPQPNILEPAEVSTRQGIYCKGKTGKIA